MKKVKIIMISSNGTIKILGANAHIAPKFFLTYANACTWCNHANKSEKWSETIPKDF